MVFKEYFQSRKFYLDIVLSIGLVIFGIGIVLLVYFLNGKSIVNACDGCFGAFAILFSIGSWQIIVNFGTFDSLCYSFANLVSTWHKGSPRKYKDLIDYKDQRIEKRKKSKLNFIVWYIVSALFLIASLVIFVIYKVNY